MRLPVFASLALLSLVFSVSARAAEETGTFAASDGVSLFWRWLPADAGTTPRGAIAHFTGTTDSCDRNLPTHRDLTKLGYSVFCHDHRGQGRSTRLGADRPVVHVEAFEEYVSDAEGVLTAMFEPRAKNLPRFLVSTSMGGAVAFLYVEKNPKAFLAHASTVPMLGINTGPIPDWFAAATLRVQCFFGGCKRYMLGLGGVPKGRKSFENNPLTSDETVWNSIEDFYQGNPDLRFGGVSAGWTLAAIGATWKIAAIERPAPLPTLILQATDDGIVLGAPQNEFCRRNPACALMQVPKAKHGLFEEVPSARTYVRQSIDAFLHARAPALPPT